MLAENGDRDLRQGVLDKARADIERVGWSAISVFPEADSPAFTYTIGLTELDQPECILFGLRPELAHGILSTYFDRVKAGERFLVGVDYDEFLVDYPVQFTLVPKPVRPMYVAMRAYPDREVEALQLIWPDKEGRWPWDEGFAYPADKVPTLSLVGWHEPEDDELEVV